MTPDCSIDLNRMVNGKGSFTSEIISNLIAPRDHQGHVQITNPEKKALIQLMINVCGIIIIIFPFNIPIIASMPAGSVIGFAGGWPRLLESFKKAPLRKPEIR